MCEQLDTVSDVWWPLMSAQCSGDLLVWRDTHPVQRDGPGQLPHSQHRPQVHHQQASVQKGEDSPHLGTFPDPEPYFQECNTDPCLILVGNKNDLWQDREVATDLACQVNLHLFLFSYFAILPRRLRPMATPTITRLRPKRAWIRCATHVWGWGDLSLWLSGEDRVCWGHTARPGQWWARDPEAEAEAEDQDHLSGQHGNKQEYKESEYSKVMSGWAQPQRGLRGDDRLPQAVHYQHHEQHQEEDHE